MRLWHYKLIPYLPNSQLIAQWRELNALASSKPKHILINYIYNYSNEYLLAYGMAIKNEMHNRWMRVNSIIKFAEALGFHYRSEFNPTLHYPEHNDRYLLQCFYNLQEKYDRGQKDFTTEIYVKLANFVKSKLRDLQI